MEGSKGTPLTLLLQGMAGEESFGEIYKVHPHRCPCLPMCGGGGGGGGEDATLPGDWGSDLSS